jgi:hypothetical protein
LSDVSDHFFTFLCPQPANQSKSNHKMSVSRDLSLPCLNKFKRELSLADWRDVLDSNDVNSAYDCFWSVYNNLFESNFPLKKKRFNKNFNPRNKFMTQGLIISRRTKNNLHALSVADPSPANINRYKNFKSIYQRLIRAAKKLFIAEKLKENASNPKKHGKP